LVELGGQADEGCTESTVTEVKKSQLRVGMRVRIGGFEQDKERIERELHGT
jgi:hypothetical protein